jgi:hypothetical protein
MTYLRSAATVQLQFWDARKRAYAPASCCEPIDSKAGRGLADIGRASGERSWRVAKSDRPLKPKYTRPHPNCQRTVADIQADYLRWAQSKGLPVVHAYSEKPPRNVVEQTTYHRVKAVTKPIFTGQIDYMTQADHFAVEESQDIPPVPEYVDTCIEHAYGTSVRLSHQVRVF